MPRLVANDIALALKKRISAGEWQENGRIPPERDLADEFGVARNTVRRAVGLLEEDGMVVRQVGRGTFLSTADTNSVAGTIARMEGTSPADIMEIRQLLEPAAVAFAATHASDSELNAVRDAHRTAVESRDLPTFEHWDAEFHQRIFACSRNDFIREIHNLVRIFRNRSPWFDMKKRSFSEERRQLYCREHGAVLDALLRRDSDGAKEAMLAHLQTVGRNLLGR
jgi:DNA-binding FadR family transcriptional regulator